jgi:hypothetical protein
MSSANSVGETISKTVKTIGPVFLENKEESPPKPPVRSAKRGAQGGAKKGGIFSAMSLIPGPIGVIGGLLGSILPSG